MTQKEIKQRYFERVYNEATWIECACGCGTQIKNKDKYGRDKKYVNGHNARKYEIGYDPKEAYRLKPENKIKLNEKRKKVRTEKNHDIKKYLLEIKGNECNNCGIKYNGTNAVIFDFHHIKDKEFLLNARMYELYTKEEILKELEKCELLCANCHRIKHNGGW